ncbi:unnamed protein product [Trichobilharzia szidati]|nr:unnamed protein product [Trichobilharzia szidati]
MRKAPYDKNAPRRPLSAFNLFMRKRRQESEVIASKPFGERNRIVSAEWANLSVEDRQMYTDQAAEARESYKKLFAEYKTTDSYKNWLASNQMAATNASKSGCKKSRKPQKQMYPGSNNNNNTLDDDFRISIFTQEFLEYNRLREATLRQLKKQASQLEEETALLSKHVENLVNAEQRTKCQIKTTTELLNNEENLMKQLCKELTIALGDITLPITTSDTSLKAIERITETSVDSFLSRLGSLKSSTTASSVSSLDSEELFTKIVNTIRLACQNKDIKLFTCGTN